MNIDFDGVFKLIVGAALTAFGWFLRTQYDSLQRLRGDHEAHKYMVARDYVAKSDLKDMESRIIDRLDRLEEKLDHRAGLE